MLLPAEAEGNRQVIRVVIVAHEDAMIAGFGKKFAMPFITELYARAAIHAWLIHRVRGQNLRRRHGYREEAVKPAPKSKVKRDTSCALKAPANSRPIQDVKAILFMVSPLTA